MYPINFLRNVAWNFVKTDFVFLLDVDFIPSQHFMEKVPSYVWNSLDSGNYSILYQVSINIPETRLTTKSRCSEKIVKLEKNIYKLLKVNYKLLKKTIKNK